MDPRKLAPHLVQKIGPEMKMDVHYVDVKLREGRVFTNVVVRGGSYITGFSEESARELPFVADDIAKIRRHALFGRLWPFWT
jgi:hypothetical protein